MVLLRLVGPENGERKSGNFLKMSQNYLPARETRKNFIFDNHAAFPAGLRSDAIAFIIPHGAGCRAPA